MSHIILLTNPGADCKAIFNALALQMNLVNV